MANFRDKTAIVGYGATEFSKNSGRSELQLAIEATLTALADAGIDPGEVDGMATFTMDNNSEFEILRAIGGRGLTFFSRIPAAVAGPARRCCRRHWRSPPAWPRSSSATGR
jgi:acetyl-CoA acetyltransferase